MSLNLFGRNVWKVWASSVKKEEHLTEMELTLTLALFPTPCYFAANLFATSFSFRHVYSSLSYFREHLCLHSLSTKQVLHETKRAPSAH